MIFRTKAGQFAGVFRGKKFFKTVHGSKHMLREPMAWAIDTDIMKSLELLKCKTVEVTDAETKVVWTAKFDIFMAKAITIDRGHGEQMALPLDYWKFKEAVYGARPQYFNESRYKALTESRKVETGETSND